MKYIALILLLFSIASCVTRKKVEKYLKKNDEEFTTVCLDKWVGMMDVKSDTVTIKSDNKDQSGLINRINKLANDSVNAKYITAELRSKIDSLNASYKPCVHDTVKITNQPIIKDSLQNVYLKNVVASLMRENESLNKRIDGMTVSNAKMEQQKTSRGKTNIVLIFILVILIGIAILIKMTRKKKVNQ